MLAEHNVKNAKIMLATFLPNYEPQDVDLPQEVLENIGALQRVWERGAGSVVPHECLAPMLIATKAHELVVVHNEPRLAPEPARVETPDEPPSLFGGEYTPTDPSSLTVGQRVVAMTEEGPKKGDFKGMTAAGLLKVRLDGGNKQTHFNKEDVEADQPELANA